LDVRWIDWEHNLHFSAIDPTAMKLELKVSGPNGLEQIVKGEALPLHDRPVVPPSATVELIAEDRERLQKATDRLRRCSVAQTALGDLHLAFRFPGGIVVEEPINELMLKALALEARPFFLNDDPLYFLALVKLKSFAANPDVARVFRGHTKRWKTSAFNGTMGITIGGHKLDVENVVSAWFNSDLFHTGPIKPDELSLAALKEMLGGGSQAQAILALHLTSSLAIVNEFLNDVAAINSPFRIWLEDFLKPTT
jgi:hypothetical protein